MLASCAQVDYHLLLQQKTSWMLIKSELTKNSILNTLILCSTPARRMTKIWARCSKFQGNQQPTRSLACSWNWIPWRTSEGRDQNHRHWWFCCYILGGFNSTLLSHQSQTFDQTPQSDTMHWEPIVGWDVAGGRWEGTAESFRPLKEATGGSALFTLGHVTFCFFFAFNEPSQRQTLIW